jgi:hypothetical protein
MPDDDQLRAFCFNRKEQVATGRQLMDIVCNVDAIDEHEQRNDVARLMEIAARHRQHIEGIPLSRDVKFKLPNFAERASFIVEFDHWLVLCPDYGAVFRFGCDLPPHHSYSSALLVGHHLVFSPRVLPE